MKKLRPCYLLLLATAACREDDGLPPACAQPPFAYTLSATAADSCAADGTITLSGTGGNNYQYRVNDGPYQNAPLFVGMLPGKYRLGIKGSGCLYTDTVTVPKTVPGALFTGVKSLLAQHCLSCHGGAATQPAPDFTSNCVIVQQSRRILARAVLGNPSPMPQSGLIPLGERNKITLWIAAGAKFTD
jgi:hypothetical protein